MERVLVACFLMALHIGTCAGATLEVRAAYYAIKTPSDPGSAIVMLRNNSKEAIEITQVLMDGSFLPCFGVGEGLAVPTSKRNDPVLQLAAARIVWARLDPNPIPPSRSALLYVQYSTRPPYAFQLRVTGQGDVAAECKLLPVDTPVRITNVAFRDDLSECLVYVENRSKGKGEQIKAVEVNDTDVTASIWTSSRETAPGAKELVTVPCFGLRVGEPVRVLVAFQSGVHIAGCVRALPTFLLALEHGPPEPSLGTRGMVHGPSGGNSAAPVIDHRVSAVRVSYGPPDGKDPGYWQVYAAEVLRRKSSAAETNMRLPTFDALSRIRPELTCTAFAHMTDAGFLNPYLPQYSRANPRHPVDAILWALDMVKAANAPNPFYSLVGVYKFGDEGQPPVPGELRRLVFTILACGARGLIYRLNQSKLTPELSASVRGINEKVTQLRPLLLPAEPVGWASSTNGQVLARTLCAGRDGVLLFLLNNGDAKGNLTSTGRAQVTVSAPEWLGGLSLAPESDPLDGSVTIDMQRIRVNVNQVPSALVLVFKGSRAQNPPIVPKAPKRGATP